MIQEIPAEERYSVYRNRNIFEGRSVSVESWFNHAVATVMNSPVLHPISELKGNDENIEIMENNSEVITNAERSLLPGKQLAMIEMIPDGLADEVDAAISGSGYTTNRANWIWGTALARICTNESGSVAKLETGWNLASKQETSAEAFIEELSIAIRSNQSADINQNIDSIVQKIKNHPEIWAYRSDRKRFLNTYEEWKKEHNFAQIWNYHLFEYFPYYCDSINILDALRRANPSRYLLLLDEICLPPITESALRHIDIKENLDTILHLLELAPVVAIEEANELPRWNRNFSIAILLNIVLDNIIKKFSNTEASEDEALIAQKDEETTKILEKTASALMKRGDWLFLSLYWMCHLIQAHNPRPMGRKRWSPIPVAIKTMAAVLQTKDVRLENFKTIFPRFFDYDDEKLKTLRLRGIGDLEKYVKPTGVDIFLVALLINNSSKSDNISVIDDTYLKWFESLLIRQDRGLHLSEHESNLESHLWDIALIYVLTPNAPESWLKSWNLLTEQRRVFNHQWMDDRISSSNDPSFFLANVGLLLIDWLLSQEIGKKEYAKITFYAVFDAVLSIVIKHPGFKNDHWRHLLASIFCRVPYVFSTEEKVVNALKLIGRIGGDDELFVWCLANIILNGVDIKEITLEFQRMTSVDLKKRLNDFITWEKRESNNRPNLKLMEECQRMIESMGKY